MSPIQESVQSFIVHLGDEELRLDALVQRFSDQEELLETDAGEGVACDRSLEVEILRCLSVFVDASDKAVSATLYQRMNQTCQPLSFFSTQLNPAQKPDKASARQLRHLSFIKQFPSDIQHASGEDNIVAVPASVDYMAITEAMKDDGELQNLRVNSKYKFKEFPIFGSNSYLLCETSDKGPFIPAEFHGEVFHAIHDLAYPGIRTTNLWRGRIRSIRNLFRMLRMRTNRWRGSIHFAELATGVEERREKWAMS